MSIATIKSSNQAHPKNQGSDNVGFKQTEVGMIPVDWEVITLNVVGVFAKGRNISRSALTSDGVPCVLYGDIYTKYHFMTSTLFRRTSVETAKSAFELKFGDILFAGSGETAEEIGKCFAYLSKETAFAGGDIVVLRPTKEFDSAYLGYTLNSDYAVSQKAYMGQGSSVFHIYASSLKQLVIPLPPTLAEQSAIATALSDMDALIAAQERLIAKKRTLKQGAMQELLTGRRRLIETDSKEYKKTEVGVIPVDWAVVKLTEIGENIHGLTYSPSDVNEYGTLVLRSSNVQEGKLAFENNVFVKMDLPPRVIVKQNDILICVRNGSKNLIGKCALIDKETEGCAFGAFMSVFRSKSPKYAFYQFQSNIIQRQINQALGATINQITNKDLSSFQIPLPPTTYEQGVIATALHDMDTEIEQLEAQLAKYRQMKVGMMQELLTGKKRLI